MDAKEIIRLQEGDITQMVVDAVVNAANNELVLGAGVAGAIRRAGGPTIQEECGRIGPIPLGEVAVTGAGNMKARYVIHAASMGSGQLTTARTLVDSTRNSLLRADEHGLRSIAFPAIGTGVAGFSLAECARLMLRTVADYLREGHSGLREVWFVLFGQEAFEAFQRALGNLES